MYQKLKDQPEASLKADNNPRFPIASVYIVVIRTVPEDNLCSFPGQPIWVVTFSLKHNLVTYFNLGDLFMRTIFGE